MSGAKGTSMRPRSSDEVSFADGTRILRRSSSSRLWCRLPRRHAVALMCYVAFVIREWMIINANMIFFNFFMLNKEERVLHFPKIADWNPDDIESMLYSFYWANAAAQIPSAMAAMSFSPHRIMGVSLFLSYILHMMIPLTLHHSAIGAIILLFLLGLFTAPLDCSCIALWRVWAPSTEKNSIILLAFSGQYIHVQVLLPFVSHLSENVGSNSIYYFAGLAGVIWCILWFSLVTDSPENDPLISEAELQLLEENVPCQNKEKIEVRSIPVKEILTSKPALSLCLVFVTSAFSSRSITLFVMIQMIVNDFEAEWLQWALAANCMLVIPAAGFLIDFLLNRKVIQTTTMKKILCCGALVIHAFFMFMFFVPQTTFRIFCVAFSFFALPYSMAGALPNILDLSPRYACAIMGIAMTLYSFSEIAFDFIMPHLITFQEDIHDSLITFIPSGLIALCTALLFGFFGSGDEQPWSSPSLPTDRSGNDAQYYPGRDMADNEILVSGSL